MVNVPKNSQKTVEKTFTGDGYPHYRRNAGKTVMKNNTPLDNRWVVPYNQYLSKKYNAHINVEICSSIKSCKYLYKYVYKGPDMACVAVESEKEIESQESSGSGSSKTQPQNIDEINMSIHDFTLPQKVFGEFVHLMYMVENPAYRDLQCMKKILN